MAEKKPAKNLAAVLLGQRGGRATAEKLTAEEKSAIGRRAATARWRQAEEAKQKKAK